MKSGFQRRQPMRNHSRSRILSAAGIAALLIAAPLLHLPVLANSAIQAAAQSNETNVTTTLKADQTGSVPCCLQFRCSLLCATSANSRCPRAIRTPQIHGHRRVHQSRDRALPLADRAYETRRARARNSMNTICLTLENCCKNSLGAKLPWCGQNCRAVRLSTMR